MCGIAGIVDWGGRDRGALTAALTRMDAAIARRGPDGEGREVVAGRGGAVACLAHRRLAILDRSPAGRQPMVASSGRHWITYNGEIYNFGDLRPALRAAGLTLRSRSDTEVLLECLVRDGDPAVTAMRGMFAFAFWDADQATLRLGRDRFGIKPLVYARPEPDLLVFASTPQALQASGFVSLEADPRQRAAFLSRGSVDPRDSFWRGIRVVPPGAIVAATSEGDTTNTYWSVTDVWPTSLEARPVADAAVTIRRAIEDSVAAHLVSDLPVAVFLSGGRDSAAIAATARAQTTGDLRALTVTMPGTSLDEGAAARAMAAQLGLDHTDVTLDDLDRDRMLEEFLASLSQPTVDGLNTFLVAQAARQAGLQVALSGVGGDELLGGYPSFREVPQLHHALHRWGGVIRSAAPLLAWWPSPRAAKLAAIAREAPAALADTWWAYRRLWSPADVSRLCGVSPPPRPEDAGGPQDPFGIVRAFEWRHFLERQLLPDADATTMCRALELRTPFVDHRVVEAVAAAGGWTRGGHASWKAALFEAWPDWSAPSERHRPKKGFVLPMDRWLREALGPAPASWRDVAGRLRQPAYAGDVEAFLAGRLHWSRLWALYVLERVDGGVS